MLSGVKLPFSFRCIRQPRRHSQYGHLREALAAFELAMPRDAAGKAATWLLFSDDDDLWHPHRARLARLACAEATAAEPGADVAALETARTRALSFGVYAYPIDEAAQKLKTAAHVDRSIQQRQCGIWLGACEVFQYAVRPSLLRSFLRGEEESVLRHRFADVRFATWMRHAHAGAVRELGADEMMRLDQGRSSGLYESPMDGRGQLQRGGGHSGGKPKPPSEQSPAAQSWLLSHWLYFYRNQRQMSAVEWLGDLDDLHDHLNGMTKGTQAATAAKAAQGGSAGGGADAQYERASTGRQQTHDEADRLAARKVLKALGPPADKASAREEEASVAAEIGRMRHHAELTVMMCMQFRNAAELAIAICEQGDPNAAAAAQGGGAEGILRSKLLKEQARLVKEALETFGHTSRKAGLPTGSVQECLA